MTERAIRSKYEGERLLSCLSEQRLVQHDRALAKALQRIGKLISYRSGDVLYVEGSHFDAVYLILRGKVALFKHGNKLTELEETRELGTWPLLFPSDPRYFVTAKAATECVVWRVGEADFKTLAGRFPQLWVRSARGQAERLKEQNERIFLPANATPKVFIGSCSQDLKTARALKTKMVQSGQKVDVVLWPDAFPPGYSYLESLMAGLDEWDFAAFLFTPNDILILEKREKAKVPRDNVVFEAGLCMGRLGRARTLVIQHQAPDLKVPSDFSGVSLFGYRKDLDEVIDDVMARIKKFSVRTRVAIDRIASDPAVR